MSAVVRALPQPEPAPEREHLAQVIELWRHRPHHGSAPRRSINGHHPDCPYPHTARAHCSVCEGIRKGGDPA